MNLPIRAIIIAARRMGATVFKIERVQKSQPSDNLGIRKLIRSE